jgi:hypothetical protein
MSEEQTGGSAGSAPITSQGQAPSDDAIKKLREEAAGYRVERNALRDRVSDLERSVAEEKGKAEVAARVADAARAKVLEAQIKSSLAIGGIADAEQQDLLLPGIMSKATAAGIEVGDDLTPKGDLDSLIRGVAEKFRSTPSDGGTPTSNPRTSSISRQLPSPHPEQKPMSARDALVKRLQSARG